MLGQELPDAREPESEESRGRVGTIIQGVLVAAGLVGLVALVRALGAAAVLESLGRLPASLFVAVLAITAVQVLLTLLTWRFAFVRAVPLRTLVIPQLAGEALNGTTPTGRVGGEGVKAWLAGERLPMRDTIVSLVVVKAADVAGQALFTLVGFVVAVATGSVDRWLVNAMLALFIVQVIAAVGFIAFQVRGGLARSGELLRRVMPAPKWAGRGAVLRVDRALALYYRRHPLRFAAGVACVLLRFAGSMLETYLVFLALGIGSPLSSAVVVTTASSAISFVTFFVPLDIGVREGGFVAASVALGLSGAAGMTVSLVKRFTDVALWSVGLLALARARRASDRAPMAAAEVLAPEA